MTEYSKSNPESIQEMFASIAKSYDRTNAALSFQLHKHWNKELVRLSLDPHKTTSLLDLCCGTGEIALTFLKTAKKPCNVYFLDFCSEMLECAKIKASQADFQCGHQLHYVQADAQKIPLPDLSIHRITVSYGIRNIKNPKACVEEAFRVLEPGGTLGILELTEPKSKLLSLFHRFYLRRILPILGGFLTSNKDAYAYLKQSIHSFSKPKEIEAMLRESGFKNTYAKPLSGGIATIVYGEKPL